jgi:hypothetical protein
MVLPSYEARKLSRAKKIGLQVHARLWLLTFTTVLVVDYYLCTNSGSTATTPLTVIPTASNNIIFSVNEVVLKKEWW